MERDFAGARLSAEAYQCLAKSCEEDPRFPARYEDWEALVLDGTKQAQAEGRPTGDITVDPDEFLKWCRRVGVHPCFDALRAYLILQRHGTALLQRHGFTEKQREQAPPPPGKQEGSTKRLGWLRALAQRLANAAVGRAAWA